VLGVDDTFCEEDMPESVCAEELEYLQITIMVKNIAIFRDHRI
jgi:hypothetical protein